MFSSGFNGGGSVGNEFDTEKKWSKSNTQSVEYRNRGNQYFGRKQLCEALDCYNTAVRYAETDSDCLVLAYSNRSAVSLELGNKHDCLMDVQRALNIARDENLDVPSKTIDKLNQRRKQCGDCASRTEGALSSNQVSPPLFSSEPSQSASHLVPGLSPAVRLCYSKTKGRHLKAAVHIPAGSVIITEQSYCSVLLQHSSSSYCHHCCRCLTNNIWIACHRCSDPNVKYCAENCRDSNWSQYHWLECGQVERLLNLGISHLALRLLLRTSHHYLKHTDLDTSMLEGKYGTKACERPVEEGNEFLWIASLETHADKLSNQDRVMYRNAAAGLIKLLKLKGYFDELRGSSSSSSLQSLNLLDIPMLSKRDVWHEKINTWLIGFIERCIGNAHAIVDVMRSDAHESLVEEVEQRIATGVYPSTSLLNHSCAPTCISSFINGNEIIVRTTRDVPAGQELTNCYGPEMGRLVRDERQQALRQQYNFQCCCVACTNDEYELIEQQMQAVRCPTCQPTNNSFVLSSTCSQCGQPPSAGHQRRIQLLINKIDRFVEDYDARQSSAIRTAQHLLDECASSLHQHHRSHVRLRDAMAACLTASGRVADAIRLTESNLDALRSWHGQSSVPVARETEKLSDLYSLVGDATKSSELARLADTIFEVHYGNEYLVRRRLARK